MKRKTVRHEDKDSESDKDMCVWYTSSKSKIAEYQVPTPPDSEAKIPKGSYKTMVLHHVSINKIIRSRSWEGRSRKASRGLDRSIHEVEPKLQRSIHEVKSKFHATLSQWIFRAAILAFLTQ